MLWLNATPESRLRCLAVLPYTALPYPILPYFLVLLSWPFDRHLCFALLGCRTLQ